MSRATTQDVAAVAQAGVCVSCLACGSTCPEGAITFTRVGGARRPSIDDAVCTHCGRCRAVCPAVHLPGVEEPVRPGDSWIVGDVRAAYVGAARDERIHDAAVSGGAATALLLGLTESGLVDRVFGCAYGGMPGEDPDLVELKGPEAILAAMGSKYAPVAAADLFAALESDESSRFAVVATPCVLTAILLFMKTHRLERSRLLAIGLVCDRTLSLGAVDYFAERYAGGRERLTRTVYRTKRVGGWPGGVELTGTDGRTIELDRDARIELKPHFQLRRCTLCADKLNRDADIVLGDCYMPGLEDIGGRSTVLVRTEAGERALAACAAGLRLMSVDVADIAASQGISLKTPSFERAIAVAEDLELPRKRTLDPDEADGVRSQIAAIWKPIAYAERAGFARTRRAIWMGRAWRRARRRASQLEMIAAVVWTYARSLGRPVATLGTEPVTDVVVTGAGFDNKGAQAMLFAVMDGVRGRFPDAEIHVAQSAAIAGAEERYRVRLLPWNGAEKACLAGWRLSRRARTHYSAWEGGPDPAAVLARSACVIDVSGFRLSSEFGVNESLDYCTNVLVARALGVPYVIMPQSIGPFDYSRAASFALRPFIRRALASATRVWAREREGCERVRDFGVRDVALAPDIVLAHPGRIAERIYRPGNGPRRVGVPARFACVVLSQQVFARRGAHDFEAFYSAIVGDILDSGRDVVLVAHSAEDLGLCRRLEQAVGDERVAIAGRELDAIELEWLIGQADFMVASRYHSLVHAYRQGVPAVIVGWATKYAELAALVGQERFVMGVDAALGDVRGAIRELAMSHAEESARIRAAMAAGFVDAVNDVVEQLAAASGASG